MCIRDRRHPAVHQESECIRKDTAETWSAVPQNTVRHAVSCGGVQETRRLVFTIFRHRQCFYRFISYGKFVMLVISEYQSMPHLEERQGIQDVYKRQDKARLHCLSPEMQERNCYNPYFLQRITRPPYYKKTVIWRSCLLYTSGNTDSNASAPIKSAGNAYPLSRTWSFGLSVSL